MERLKELLSRRQPRRIVDSGRVASAVLLPVFREQGQYHVLFIRRSKKVKVHQGQISFPGGTREASDAMLRDTALRESAEEIGLEAADIDVIGELDDAVTNASNYVVTTFVGLIPWPYRFRLNKDEVDEVITVPVAALEGNGHHRDDHTFHYGGLVIWGATARILEGFLGIFREALPEG